jgi:hypothetical protein
MVQKSLINELLLSMDSFLDIADKNINKIARGKMTHLVMVETTSCGAESLSKILEKINDCGKVGHSFGIKTDDDDPVNLGGWDGDGSDHIGDITIREILTDEDKEKEEQDHVVERMRSYILQDLSDKKKEHLEQVEEAMDEPIKDIIERNKKEKTAAINDNKLPEKQLVNMLRDFDKKMKAKEDLEEPAESLWAEEMPLEDVKKATQWLTEWLQKNAEDENKGLILEPEITLSDLTRTANEYYNKLLSFAQEEPEEETHPMEDIERAVLTHEYSGGPKSDINIRKLIEALKDEQKGFSQESPVDFTGEKVELDDDDEGFEDE